MNRYVWDRCKNEALKRRQSGKVLPLPVCLLYMEALGSVCEMDLGEAAPSKQRENKQTGSDIKQWPNKALTCATHPHTHQWHTEMSDFVPCQHTARLNPFRLWVQVFHVFRGWISKYWIFSSCTESSLSVYVAELQSNAGKIGGWWICFTHQLKKRRYIFESWSNLNTLPFGWFILPSGMWIMVTTVKKKQTNYNSTSCERRT